MLTLSKGILNKTKYVIIMLSLVGCCSIKKIVRDFFIKKKQADSL